MLSKQDGPFAAEQTFINMFHCHKTFIMSLLFMQRCERRSYNPVPCDDSNDNYDVVPVVVVVVYLDV